MNLKFDARLVLYKTGRLITAPCDFENISYRASTICGPNCSQIIVNQLHSRNVHPTNPYYREPIPSPTGFYGTSFYGTTFTVLLSPVLASTILAFAVLLSAVLPFATLYRAVSTSTSFILLLFIGVLYN